MASGGQVTVTSSIATRGADGFRFVGWAGVAGTTAYFLNVTRGTITSNQLRAAGRVGSGKIVRALSGVTGACVGDVAAGVIRAEYPSATHEAKRLQLIVGARRIHAVAHSILLAKSGGGAAREVALVQRVNRAVQ